jgi:cytochrome oxidase Cu insertion factor (SCO1/SenC/PrrC family)
MNSEVINEQPQRSNTALWVLVASFFIPAILAYVYFYYGDRPAIKSNGELIIPIVDIHTLKITDKSGAALSEEKLTPNWRMIYFVGASCDMDCQTSLYNMRQVNIAMGKYQDRVSHGIVHLAEPDAEFAELIKKEHVTADNIYAKTENIQALSGLKSESNAMKSIYLIDPLGNIMMHFPKDLNPKLMRKDINKLLKISRLR